jgi:neutral ceramidase
MAHNNLEDASTLLSFGDLYGSNINRSPTSYLLNPESERNNYPEGDTDKRMFLLQFISKTSKAILGVLNWFAVHGTSMNNTNTLVSGDNRGYASYMLEKYVNGEDSEVGKGKFVAAFASTNLGDVSPNTNGAKCIDTGLPCDGVSSSCNGRCEKCIAFGPGTNGDNFESTQIIGNKQYEFAKALMANVTEEIDGVIDYRHSFVDMSKLNVTLADGSVVTLCRASMGYSFAAGTTDGPGMFGFTQGTTTGNPFWDKVSSFLSKPTQEEIDCQAPKPILLNTGDIDIPYAWDPQTVPIQIIRLGNVFVLAAPCELTTMAGRRLRNAVKSILREGNIVDPNQEIYVTISGLANSYASYVTTYEEYQAQRYEAASTLYGPHTLEGYIQEFSRLARDMVNGNPSTTGAPPADLSDEMIQLVPEPKFDRTADGASFGDVVKGKDVNRLYMPGETVSVTFHAANPRNNQRIQGSYLTVEYYQSDNDTVPVAHDGDWSTKFRWQAGVDDPFALGFSAISYATISWQIPSDAKLGAYRICYFGDSKESADATPAPFTGCSSQFRVLETITVIPKQG